MVFALIVFLLGGLEVWTIMDGTAGLVLLGIAFSMREPKALKQIQGLTRTFISSTEFQTRYATDPDFQHAVDFYFNLAPNEFLRFTRMIVDMRYETDQDALRGRKA